jgi:hypothetical protein
MSFLKRLNFFNLGSPCHAFFEITLNFESIENKEKKNSYSYVHIYQIILLSYKKNKFNESTLPAIVSSSSLLNP